MSCPRSGLPRRSLISPVGMTSAPNPTGAGETPVRPERAAWPARSDKPLRLQGLQSAAKGLGRKLIHLDYPTHRLHGMADGFRLGRLNQVALQPLCQCLFVIGFVDFHV